MDGSAAIFAKNTLKDDPVPWDTGILTQTFEFESKRLQAAWRPKAFYAPFVELGTKYTVAQPFMGAILEKSSSEVSELFAQALDQVLKKIS